MSRAAGAGGAGASAQPRCPLCGAPLYGWVAVRPPAAAVARATAAGKRSAKRAGERIYDRCEECGVAVERGAAIDLEAEWRALRRGPDGAVEVANRASVQAGIGEAGWAGLGATPGRLVLTPRSLELLAERVGARLGRHRFMVFGRNQAWMWQTLVNGLTFETNFAREAWAGRLRPSGARERLVFAIDAIVTALAAPLVALVSLPLETLAVALGRGGVIVAPVEEEGGSALSGAGRRGSRPA